MGLQRLGDLTPGIVLPEGGSFLILDSNGQEVFRVRDGVPFASGPALSDATPLPASGSGSAGAGVTASRGDHAHPGVAAAHVVPETATPQQIAEALIAAGLMEAE